MFKKSKIKKILASSGVLALFILQILPAYTQAAIITSSLSSGGSASISTSSLGATEISDAPSVSISFPTTGSFKSGTTVTASATASGFYDNPSELYYTWYLKKSYGGDIVCDLTKDWWEKSAKEDDEDVLEKCDLDNDDLITPNDWKIAATRIIIKGTFDRTSADYSSSIDEEKSGAEAVPAVVSSSASDEGWIKNFEKNGDGDIVEENDKDAINCYFRQPESGIVYELRETTPDFNTCPDGYHPSCIKDISATCDTSANPLVPDDTFGACSVISYFDDTTALAPTGAKCKINNATDYSNYQASIECGSGETAFCTKGSEDTDMDNALGDLLGSIFKYGSTDAEMCAKLATPHGSPPPTYEENTNPAIEADVEVCSNLTSTMTNGTDASDMVSIGPGGDYREVFVESNPELANTCTFEKGPNLCKHLFPYFPEKTVTVDGKSLDLFKDDPKKYDKTGDGKFSIREKQFWGADPTTASTNGSGIKDEAVVMGLGVNNFSWIYNTGDEIGVVVEGASTSFTEHNDSSHRIMWAFSKNTCTAMEDIEDSTSLEGEKRSFYIEEQGDSLMGIHTADFDLDRCLEENLVSPGDNGSNSSNYMSVSLTATPNDPINDPDGTYSDTLRVVASVQNVSNLSNVYYTWEIEKNDQAAVLSDDVSWTNKTSEIKTYGSIASSEGIGKNALNVLLNLPDAIVASDGNANGEFYLRIKVKAEENSGAENQTSVGVLIVKVQQQQESIAVYSVTAGNDGELSFDKPICTTKAEQIICPSTKYRIIGVKVPDEDNSLSGFSWKVNNVSMPICNPDLLPSECSGTENNALVFPILGNVGESVSVVTNAKNTETGGTIEVKKNFIIVEPQVVIRSADEGSIWRKLLGYDRDLNSSASCFEDASTGCTAVYSDSVFQTRPGNTAKLKAVSYASWGNSTDFEWAIDGATQETYGDTLEFSVDKDYGDSYNIGVNLVNNYADVKQINNLRKALLNNWGISPDESAADENVSANIQAEVVEDSYETASLDKSGIFASLITNLPENLMFLLKITLTSVVLMFSLSLLFAFIPESLFEKDKNEVN